MKTLITNIRFLAGVQPKEWRCAAGQDMRRLGVVDMPGC